MITNNEERFLTLLLELHVKMNRLESEIKEIKEKNDELKRKINLLEIRNLPDMPLVPPKDSSNQPWISKRPLSMDFVY